MMIRGLIFDFDGLMVDTESPAYDSWREVYQEYGCELPLALWQAVLGGSGKEFDPCAYLEQQIGNDPTALYLDTAHAVAVVATSASSSSTGATTLTFAGYDARTLAPAWTATAPYDPATTRFDPARGQLWLVAQGGRVTVLSTRTGRTVATIDPSYTKAQYWTQNKDLVLDGARGLGYISWGSGTTTGGQQVGIDRIDLRAGRRTTITTDGGTLLAVATRSGRLVTLDAGGPIVVRRPTDGRVVGTLGDYRTLTGQDLTTENVGGAAVAAVAQDGERVVLALPATVPYQDPVSGATTTGGLATVTFRDRP